MFRRTRSGLQDTRGGPGRDGRPPDQRQGGPVTERLSSSLASDSIDALLRVLRVSSTLLCRSKLGAPWGFGVRAHGLAAFHVVTAGDCWLQVDGDDGGMQLRAGDLAILPRGDTHWLRDDPDSPTLWLEDLL